MMLDPYDHDWSQESDVEVYNSAKAGIPPAIEEANKRGLLKPRPPEPSDGMG